MPPKTSRREKELQELRFLEGRFKAVMDYVGGGAWAQPLSSTETRDLRRLRSKYRFDPQSPTPEHLRT